MQVTIHRLSVDIYPYNTAGQLYFYFKQLFCGLTFLPCFKCFSYFCLLCDFLFGDFNVEFLFSLVTRSHFERSTHFESRPYNKGRPYFEGISYFGGKLLFE